MINICFNVSMPEDCMVVAYELTKEMEELGYENNTPLKVDDYIYNCELISNRKYHKINKINGFDYNLYEDMYYFKALIKFPKTTVNGIQDMELLTEQLDRMEKVLSCGHNFISYEESDIRKLMDDFDFYKETIKSLKGTKGDKNNEM